MSDSVELGEAAAFARALPKAELHIHIEGTLEPEHMLRLGERNRVHLPYPHAEAARAAYQFSSLQSFLDVYYDGLRVLRTGEDFFELTLAYLARAQADNVVHAEIFFDPQAHTSRDVPFGEVIEGISAALRLGESRYGLSTGLIMCFLRHLPESAAFETLAAARPYLERLIGVGLDSSEVGYPPSLFAGVFAAARDLGLHCVAHAGEEGPADYVREALDLLKAERIEHGIRSIDDPELVRRLATTRVPITVCPISNLRLCVVPDLAAHPLKRMLDRGVNVSIHSDDPAYFRGYIGDVYVAAVEQMGLRRSDLVTMARNSLEAAFILSLEVDRGLKSLEEIADWSEISADYDERC